MTGSRLRPAFFVGLFLGLLAVALQGVQSEDELEAVPSEDLCRPYIEKALKDLGTGSLEQTSAETGDDGDGSHEEGVQPASGEADEPGGEAPEGEGGKEGTVSDEEDDGGAERSQEEAADDQESAEGTDEQVSGEDEQQAGESPAGDEEGDAEELDGAEEEDTSGENVERGTADSGEARVEDEKSEERDTDEVKDEDKDETGEDEDDDGDSKAGEAGASKEEDDGGESIEGAEDSKERGEEADSKADEEGDSKADEEGDSKAEEDGETRVDEVDASVEGGGDEADDSKEGDSKADEEGDSKADEEGDSKADEEGDTKADEEGDSKADEEGDSKADEEGDSKADEEGDSKADEEGDSKADDAEGASTEDTGEVESKEVEGETDGQQADSKEEGEKGKEDAGEESGEKVESQEEDKDKDSEEKKSDEEKLEIKSRGRREIEESDEKGEQTEGEEGDKAEESDEGSEGDEEPTPEEDLIQEIEVPENLRPREHINQLLKLDEENEDKERAIEKVADIVLRDLKRLYDNAIKPLETLYKYRDLSNRHFGDPEIFSKPLVLFMGPWSGGKSSIINYLLDIEYKRTSLRTGAEPSPAYFNILMHGEEEEVLDGTQLAADWTFSGLQKFGQGMLDRLRGLRLNSKLLEKVNVVEIPGILEIRKQVQRLFPFNDACQWFIDRADIIFLVYDPSKLDVGPETEAILDQLKGREYQTRIVLNKADQVKPEELMRVQGALIWNISPLMSSAEPPIMYSTSLWSLPYEAGAPTRLLYAQERAFLRDLRTAIDKRVEHKIASARRFAVRVRNHAKMVDCYLTTYYNHKTFFGNKKEVSDRIVESPQDYHIYEGLSTLTNISRYDLPDPDVYRDFFRLNPLYDFPLLSSTCTYFRGCPINRLDVAIAYDLPELVGKYRKSVEAVAHENENGSLS